MGKTKTSGKGRLDKFYYLAKEQGYRSRAAFKLVQLNRKYGFLEKSRTLLDLCAAPGGWLQVAAKYMPMSSVIIGVDLAPIRPIRGCITMIEDITTPKCRAAIKKELKGSLLDCVLHDGSPNVGGAWSSEAYTQSALTLEALKLATELLVPGGIFVTKVFRSQDYNSLLFAFNQLFERVEATKPVASRNTSAEIYVVCRNYKAPGKIDPRLLDSKHLFQAAEGSPKVKNVLEENKQKRQREGYADGQSLVRKDASAVEFIASDKPAEFLGSYTCIHFKGGENGAIKAHPATTEEIKALCEDLGVLGKREFKQLLKWRMAVRKSQAEEEAKPEEDVEEKPAVRDEAAEEEKLLSEMQELKDLLEAKKKKAKKSQKKRKEKAKARASTGVVSDAVEDGVYADEDLFDLKAIKSKKGLRSTEEAEAPDEDEVMAASDEDSQGGDYVDEEDSAGDEEESAKKLARLEAYFDQAYERYKDKVGGKKTTAQRRHRARLGEEADEEKGDLWEDDDHEDAEPTEDGDNEAEPEEENPLLVPLEREQQSTGAQLASQWFSQGIFEGFGEDDKADEEEDEQPTTTARGKQNRKRSPEKDAFEFSEDEDQDRAPAKKVRKMKASQQANGTTASGQTTTKPPEEDPGFEEVKAGSSDSDTSSSDDEDYDSDEKAEIRAYAKRMLKKKPREELIDEAYNRYMFDDPEVPKWFAEDERRHMQPMKPVTKEDIEIEKSMFRSIDSRTPKKVAEAKARKRNKMLKKLEQVRQKANAISDSADMNDRAKSKMIERLYKKASKKEAPKKGGNKKLDNRMKKDARQRGKGKTKGGKKGYGNLANVKRVKKGGGKSGPVKGGKGGKAGKGEKAGGKRGKAR